jgi:hypothetical protein
MYCALQTELGLDVRFARRWRWPLQLAQPLFDLSQPSPKGDYVLDHMTDGLFRGQLALGPLAEQIRQAVGGHLPCACLLCGHFVCGHPVLLSQVESSWTVRKTQKTATSQPKGCQVAVNLITSRKESTISLSRQTGGYSLEVSHLSVFSALRGGAFSAGRQYTRKLSIQQMAKIGLGSSTG